MGFFFKTVAEHLLNPISSVYCIQKSQISYTAAQEYNLKWECRSLSQSLHPPSYFILPRISLSQHSPASQYRHFSCRFSLPALFMSIERSPAPWSNTTVVCHKRPALYCIAAVRAWKRTKDVYVIPLGFLPSCDYTPSIEPRCSCSS